MRSVPDVERDVRSTLVAAAVARFSGAFASGDPAARDGALRLLRSIGTTCLTPALAALESWRDGETRSTKDKRQIWLAEALCALLHGATAAEIVGSTGHRLEHLAIDCHAAWANPERSMALRLTGRAPSGPSAAEQDVADAWAAVIGALCPARLTFIQRGLQGAVRSMNATDAAVRVSSLRCIRLDDGEASIAFVRTVFAMRERRHAVKNAAYLALAEMVTASGAIGGAHWRRFVAESLPLLREDAKKEKYKVSALAAMTALSCCSSPPVPTPALMREVVACAGRTASPAALAAVKTLIACVLGPKAQVMPDVSPEEFLRHVHTNLFAHNTAIAQLRTRGQPAVDILARLSGVMEGLVVAAPEATVTDVLANLPHAGPLQLHLFFSCVPAAVRGLCAIDPAAEAEAGMAPLSRPCYHVNQIDYQAKDSNAMLRSLSGSMHSAFTILFSAEEQEPECLAAALQALQALAPAHTSVGELVHRLVRLPSCCPEEEIEIVAGACACESVTEICQHIASDIASPVLLPTLVRVVEAEVVRGRRLQRGAPACVLFANEVEVLALQLLCDPVARVRASAVKLLDLARDARGMDGGVSLMDIADGVEESLGLGGSATEASVFEELAGRDDFSVAWGNLLGLFIATGADACPTVVGRAWEAVVTRWEALFPAVSAAAEAIQRQQSNSVAEQIVHHHHHHHHHHHGMSTEQLQLWRYLSVMACAGGLGAPGLLRHMIQRQFALLRGHDEGENGGDAASHAAAGPSPVHRDIALQALSHIHPSAQVLVLETLSEEDHRTDSGGAVQRAAARVAAALPDALVATRVRSAAAKARWLEACTSASIYRAIAHRIGDEEWAADAALRGKLLTYGVALHQRALQASSEQLGWNDVRVQLCMLVTSLARLQPAHSGKSGIGRDWRVDLFRDLRRWAASSLELVHHTPPPAAVLEQCEPVSGDPPPSLLHEAHTALVGLLTCASVPAQISGEVLDWIDSVLCGPALGQTFDCRRLVVSMLADNPYMLSDAIARTRLPGLVGHFYAAALAEVSPMVTFEECDIAGAVHAALVFAGDSSVRQLGEVLLGSKQVTSAGLATKYPGAVIQVLQLLFSGAEGLSDELLRRKQEVAEQWLAGARLQDASSRVLLEFMFSCQTSTIDLWATLATTEYNVEAIVHYVVVHGPEQELERCAQILGAVASRSRKALQWILSALSLHLQPLAEVAGVENCPQCPQRTHERTGDEAALVAGRAAALGSEVIRAGHDHPSVLRPFAALFLHPAAIIFSSAAAVSPPALVERCGMTLAHLIESLAGEADLPTQARASTLVSTLSHRSRLSVELTPTILLLLDAVEHEPGVVKRWGELALTWVVVSAGVRDERTRAFAMGSLGVVRVVRPGYSYRALLDLSMVVQKLMRHGDKELLPQLVLALKHQTDLTPGAKLLLTPQLVWLAVALTHEPAVELSAPALELLHSWLRHPLASEQTTQDLLSATAPDWSGSGLSAHLQPAALSGLCDAATQATSVHLLVLLAEMPSAQVVDPSAGRLAMNITGLLPWMWHALNGGGVAVWGLDVSMVAAVLSRACGGAEAPRLQAVFDRVARGGYNGHAASFTRDLCPLLSQRLRKTGHERVGMQLLLRTLQGGSSWSIVPTLRVLLALITASDTYHCELAQLAELPEWEGVTRLLDQSVWEDAVSVMTAVLAPPVAAQPASPLSPSACNVSRTSRLKASSSSSSSASSTVSSGGAGKENRRAFARRRLVVDTQH